MMSMGARVSARKMKALMAMAPAPLQLSVGPAAVLPDIDEATFQEQVIDELILNGWEYYHNPDSRRSTAGFQDLVIVHEGRKRCLFVELKTDDGRERPDQKKWRRMLNACGLTAVVWRPRDWAMIRRELRGE